MAVPQNEHPGLKKTIIFSRANTGKETDSTDQLKHCGGL